jgi:cytochrome c oxidase accessory protein FixG
MQSGLEEQLGLYQKRIPIVTRSIKGRFRRFKTTVLVLAYSLYFLLPWLPWVRSNGPAQAVLFDIPGRRFLLFGLAIYPQDVIWLALLLFIAALLLFFVTGLVGRAFCGYFCFQTIWTDFFVWIERRVQGERPARIRLYRQPWNREKLIKVGGTHALWLLVSFWTALSFVRYFGYAPDLLIRFFSADALFAAYLTTALLTLTTYAAAGLMREQVCAYVCPYGRFQSVMVEPQTLAVHYDARRGEREHGRAAARAGLRTLEARHAKGIGDCVDCGLCVQVCPAGIDIRDGLQYPCISCGLCIDACNSIMVSFGFPQGLIRYDAEANLAQAVPTQPRLHWKRLNVIGYGVATLLMSAWLIYSISHRTSFDFDVMQVRQPLYVVLSNGDIRNRYQVRITNKSGADMHYRIAASGLPHGALDLGHFSEIAIPTGHSAQLMASVHLSPESAEHIARFQLIVAPIELPHAQRSTTVRLDRPQT